MSFHPQKPWKSGEQITAARLQDQQERPVLNVTVSPPLRMARVGQSVSLSLDTLGTSTVVVWVEIAGTITGEGAYTCKIGVPNTNAAFNPSTDGASHTQRDYVIDAYFIDIAEEGKGTHWLDVGGHYPGFYDGVASDGKPVIRYHTFDTQVCEGEDPVAALQATIDALEARIEALEAP